jgi:hypothetical protein
MHARLVVHGANITYGNGAYGYISLKQPDALFGYNLMKLSLSAYRTQNLHVLGHERRSQEKLDQRLMCQIVALNLTFANYL